MINIIGSILLLVIVLILVQKGKVKNIRYPIIKNKFVYDHHENRQLKVSYEKFNGVDNYPFFLQPEQQTDLHYDIDVQEGAVELTFKIGKEIVFNKEFHESEKGSISFIPDKKSGILLVTGKFTKGGCNVSVQNHS